MKFTLTFEGRLPSGNRANRNPAIWKIRQQIHPQLVELWRTHPALVRLAQGSTILKYTGTVIEPHHSAQVAGSAQFSYSNESPDTIDLCRPIEKGGRIFQPLVRETFSLVCGVSIKFLRPGAVGGLYPGGDLDNRIKTLLDALSIPQHDNQMGADIPVDGTIYCLCEDDRMFAGIAVETGRLLSQPTIESADYVKLIIDVDVRVTDSRYYNTLFLGD